MHAGTPEPLSTYTDIRVRTWAHSERSGTRLGLWNIATAVAAACVRSLREGPRVLLPIGQENSARGCSTIDRMLSNALRSSSRALLRALSPFSPFPSLSSFSPLFFYCFSPSLQRIYSSSRRIVRFFLSGARKGEKKEGFIKIERVLYRDII